MIGFNIYLIVVYCIVFQLTFASIERVRNYKIIKTSKNIQSSEEILLKRDALESKMSEESFPSEMTAHFEAFDRHFELKLQRNDAFMMKKSIGEEDYSFGAAYSGISLLVTNKSAGSSSKDGNVLVDDQLPFARFFATLKDGEVFLQGGFEWEKSFFKLTSGNHPSIRYHVSPNDSVSLLKRMESTRTDSPDIEDDELVISKESMDPRQKKTFGFSFNSGSNSTIPYRCGHDDVKFNVDPRGVGNDFAKKISQLNNNEGEEENSSVESQKINPLTAQYYLAKRANSDSGCPVNRKVLYIGIAADSAYLDKFDGNRQAAIANVLSDFNLVSAIYEKTFNVEIGIHTITILNRAEGKKTNSAVPWDLPCEGVNIGQRLNAFSKWRDGQNKDVGLYHLVSGCAESETVGIAWLNQVCQVKSFKGSDAGDIVSGTSVSVLIPNQFAVIAHEIGHNFGAIHDCDSRDCQACKGRDCKCCTCGPCDCQGKFVMNSESGGLNVRQFSPCSQNDICYKMNVIGKCLQEPGKLKTLKTSTCGNGILEEGEECDCGSEAECKGNPCCQFGCKLREGAACSDGNEACCDKCQIRKAADSFKCFTSKSVCQFDSTCDGKSAKCPITRKAIDGTSCEAQGGKCASGVCTSRDIQCRTVGKRLGINRACQKMPNTCQLICESSSSGSSTKECVAMSAFFMDGTPCGSSGTCTNGKCSESSISSLMEDNSTLVVVLGVTVGSLLCVLLLRALLGVNRRSTRPANTQDRHLKMFLRGLLFKMNYSNVSKLGRADRGLYAGRSVSFGNTISDFGNRHRRTWKPNVQYSSLYSAILQQRVKLRVSTEALRQIDKLGGLDSYILAQKIPESECARKLKESILARKLQQEV